MKKTDFEKVKKVWVNNPDHEYQNSISHVRGVWNNYKSWSRWGERTLSKIKQCFSFLDRPMNALKITEWGVGGGSNLNAFASYTEKYIGIDISPYSLSASDIIAKEHNLPFESILTKENPQDVLNLYPGPVDLFISTAVFQHFPSKDYTIEVLQTIPKLLKINGVGLIQIRYDNRDGSPKSKSIESIDEYEEKAMTATSFILEDFWKQLKCVSLQPLYITGLEEKSQYATFLFTRSEVK